MAGSGGANVGRYALIELALHGLLYVFLFLCAAFVARRNFVRRRQTISDSAHSDEGEKGFSGAISAVANELSDFFQDPIPFVLETSAADSDTVQYRAGLEARLYLHVLWSLMKLFAFLTGVAILIILPINVLTTRLVPFKLAQYFRLSCNMCIFLCFAHSLDRNRMPWAARDSFSVTTANGFVQPHSSLLAHTVVSVAVSLSVLYVVWNVRSYVLKHARSFVDASASSTPPAQASFSLRG